MRAFIGVPLDEGLKDDVRRVQEEFRDPTRMKPVSRENLHWSVKFLGEIDSDEKEGVRSLLEDLKSSENPFSITLRGVGAFPSTDFVRVVWIGVEDGTEFTELMEVVEERTHELGFDRSDHDPKPHLTLGRVKDVYDKDRLQKLFSRYEGEKFGTMTVDNLVLYKSVLRSEGPEYSIIHRVEFG